MSDCGCGCTGAGPYAKGKELVEFVYNAHGGSIRSQPIRNGGIETTCQGCCKDFILETYVGHCPHCGGIHAVAPIHPTEENIQYGGTNFLTA